MKKLLNEMWAISPRHFQVVTDLLLADAPQAAATSSPHRQANDSNGVGILTIHGPIMPRSDWVTDLFGLQSYERIAAGVTKLAADRSVREIILDIDSPGGVALGTDEAAAAIAAAAKVKPVNAIVNGYAASAAYWLASQATSITITPMSQVGSIGVIALHADYSAMLSDAGLDVKVYRTGSMKALGQIVDSHDEVAAAFAAEQGSILQVFAQAVADGRGFTLEEVLTRFALDSGMDGALAGDTVMGQKAVTLGLADTVSTREVAMSSVKTRTMTGRRHGMGTEGQEQVTLQREGKLPKDAAEQTAQAVATAEKTISDALGISDVTPETLARVRAEAADGRQYRADLLDRLHAATIRAEGNTEEGIAAADRIKRVFATASVSDILQEATRQESREVVPETRVSRVDDPTETTVPAVDYSRV